ncbi:MAG: hypothetical protein LAN64_14680 [Acidobacteriia bacterium]|nr:hypothetical protein [Terriglobia bacterium]
MKSTKSVILGILCGALAAFAAHAQVTLAVAPPLSLATQPILSAAQGERQGGFTEEFHQTYPLNPGGRIELKNINGRASITSWNRNEVKVDALKYAGTRESLAEAEIQVRADLSSIAIKTHYQDHNLTFTDNDPIHNPASVDYTLTVPADALLDGIKLVNGNLDLQNISGDVHASCINGRLRASGLRGRTDLSTVNGTLDVSFNSRSGVILSERPGVGRESKDLGERPAHDERSESHNAPTRASELADVKLKSVNGSVVLTLPSDADAEVTAKTVSGFINNDFGLPVNDGRYVGHSLAGRLGSGAAHIELKNVNGSISLQRASDGKPLSPATNLLPPKRAELD